MAFIIFKAIGNAEDFQLSSQLVVVGCLLLVEAFESLNVLVGFGKLLSLLSSSLMYSGDIVSFKTVLTKLTLDLKLPYLLHY